MKSFSPNLLVKLSISFILLILTACIQPISPVAAPKISVAGEYKTVVTLSETNSCGDVTVMSLPTTIDQAPGATEFTFTHAGNSYAATLEADGTFVTEQKAIIAGGTTYSVTFEGKFSTTGFDGLGTVEILQNKAPKQCLYVVKMEGELMVNG